MCKVCDDTVSINDIQLAICSRVRVLPQNLPLLQRLDFIQNRYVKHIPNYFNLTYLNCSYSNIQSINQNLTKLTYLNARNTKLSHLPKSLCNIRDLNIQFTKIKSIPDNYKQLEIKRTKGSLIQGRF